MKIEIKVIDDNLKIINKASVSDFDKAIEKLLQIEEKINQEDEYETNKLNNINIKRIVAGVKI